MGIYVEARIRGTMDELWRLTQTPDLHARWDLRFTHIEYLPRPDDAQPQRFLYATRIGLGLAVEGRGETVGQRDGAGGERASALRFWSDDSRSLIREGAGYWRYVPAADGLRFFTYYDYRVRFGALGRLVDRLAAQQQHFEVRRPRLLLLVRAHHDVVACAKQRCLARVH